jgi:AAA domain
MQNRLPLGGITCLDGDHGLGKSLLALQIAAAVSAGTPMPDDTPSHQPSGVVIISPSTHASVAQLPLLKDLLTAELIDRPSRGLYTCTQSPPAPNEIPTREPTHDLNHIAAITAQPSATDELTHIPATTAQPPATDDLTHVPATPSQPGLPSDFTHITGLPSRSLRTSDLPNVTATQSEPRLPSDLTHISATTRSPFLPTGSPQLPLQTDHQTASPTAKT